jgi:hypothetical protein
VCLLMLQWHSVSTANVTATNLIHQLHLLWYLEAVGLGWWKCREEEGCDLTNGGLLDPKSRIVEPSWSHLYNLITKG